MKPNASQVGQVKERVASPGAPKTRPARSFVSVGTKLTGAILLVLAVVTAVAYLRVNSNEREQLLSAKERAATMVTELFAAGVTAPLSFNDDKGAREHLALLMASTNVVYVGLWRADGARRGEKIGEIAKDTTPVPRPSVAIALQLEVERTADAVIIQKPVISDSGEVLGAVLIECSLAGENAAIAAAQRRTLVTFSATALGLAVVVLALSQTLVVRRLAQLAKAAKRLEEGEVVDIQLDTNDEVGALSRAFASMSRVIATREAQISQRNRDLRRVLDNVAEGLMTVRKDGLLSDERSRAVDEWFGAPVHGTKLDEYFQAVAPAMADLLRLGWMALNDDMMPVEVILDQMRGRFEHGQRSFELDFSPIWSGPEENQVLDEVLVVVRDVTAVVERERAELAQREGLRVFRCILVDPAGFREFLRNGTRLVEAIEQARGMATTARLRRHIHTLKGDTALYGIESIATICHRIESRMQEAEGPPTAEELSLLRAAWNHIKSLAAELESGSATDRIEIHVREYEEHLAQLKAHRSDDALLTTVRSWTNERAERTLQRFAEQGRSLARRVGKGDTTIDVSVTPASLRLAPARWAEVWSVFSHVLRNTLDHGVETSAERQAANKSPRARVEISLTASREGVALRVADDGRGIDWEKVRERGEKLGLPHATPADLEEALYADNVSTRERATEISGRGIGMGAVRDVIRNCGGEITIDSRPGAGTSMTCWFPVAMLEVPRSSLAPVPKLVEHTLGREGGRRFGS
jgi:signal transduction histidine kinase/HPt (histidine-containing phosphotransfer) domain-containing protein